MSRDNVEIVRQVSQAYNSADLGKAVSFFHADAIFEEPPNQPGAQVVRGRDAVLETFQRFDEAWKEHRSELRDIRALDDGRVLMFSLERLVGRDGIEFTQDAWNLYTLRDGEIVRWQAFWDEGTALQAAGLGE